MLRSDDIAGLRDWWRRAGQHIDAADLLHLTPWGALAMLRSFARARAASTGPVPAENDLAARDPELVRLFLDLFRALGTHYFRWDVQGTEHVPQHGPALLVGSHNGGMICTDSVLTMVAIWDRLGPERAVHPLSHDILFHHPAIGRYARGMGILRASQESAQKALRAGRLVLVYPGSDLDSCRPFRDRYRIELGRRTGFLKLALREGVPIIPVVSAGTHEQFVVLTRGDRLARLIGGKRRLRINVCPIVLSLPWGLTSGFLPYLPLPAQTSLAFGPPLHLPRVSPEQANDPALLGRCYEQVEAHMQQLMDRVSAGRLPLLGRRAR